MMKKKIVEKEHKVKEKSPKEVARIINKEYKAQAKEGKAMKKGCSYR